MGWASQKASVVIDKWREQQQMHADETLKLRVYWLRQYWLYLAMYRQHQHAEKDEAGDVDTCDETVYWCLTRLLATATIAAMT